MSCFGGTPVALKEEYLKNTPFFLLAAETDDATILPELAKYATPRKSTAAKWAAARAAAMELSLQSVCQVMDDDEAESPTAADDAAPVRRSSAAARASLNWG